METGRRVRILPSADFVAGYVTPSGRYAVVWRGRDGGLVSVIDLVDGDRTTIRPTPDPALWELVEMRDDRYIVMRKSSSDGSDAVEQVLVHDLVEGWTGYLPWQAQVSSASGGTVGTGCP